MDLVELLLFDEVFLDIIVNKKNLDLVSWIVWLIWEEIKVVIGFNVLVGVFVNKFMVKVVLDINKLNGQKIIFLEDVLEFFEKFFIE